MKNIDYIRKASVDELVLFLYFYGKDRGSMKKIRALLEADVSEKDIADIEKFAADKLKGFTK